MSTVLPNCIKLQTLSSFFNPGRSSHLANCAGNPTARTVWALYFNLEIPTCSKQHNLVFPCWNPESPLNRCSSGQSRRPPCTLPYSHSVSVYITMTALSLFLKIQLLLRQAWSLVAPELFLIVVYVHLSRGTQSELNALSFAKTEITRYQVHLLAISKMKYKQVSGTLHLAWFKLLTAQ